MLALVAGLLAITTTAAEASHDFPDVPDDHPFHEEISWMADEGIATGYRDGTFRSTVTVSRQAVVAFLYRLEGSPPGDYSSDFDDVPEDHAFYDEISWAAEEGIVTGYGDGTFRPTSLAARQASAAFLYRFAGEPLGDYSNDFDDVPADQTFHDEISWMAENGITTGYADDTFRPTRGSSRQAMAAFLYRFDNLGMFLGMVADVSDTQAGEVEDGEPIEGAAVHVTDGDDVQRTARTDADGIYFVYVPEGTYDLEATADGYAEAYGYRVTEVGVTAGGVTGVDFGLYPTATEPDEATPTGSDASDVEERENWWVIEARDATGTPLPIDGNTDIVYANPSGDVVSLGNAGTGADSWWAKPTEHRWYADGEHTLYYNLGTSGAPDWHELRVGFADGQLISVNGQLYPEAAESASAQSADGAGDDEPDEGVVVPND